MGYSGKNAILLMCDSTTEARAITRAFAERGRLVSQVESDFDLLTRASLGPAVIIDRFKGGTDQIVLVERLRNLNISTPVVMISASDSPYDDIDCLNAGADQFVAKPLNMERLVAHVEAAIRSASVRKSVVCTVKDLSIDLVARSARRGQRLITLSGREFDLLAHLMLHAGTVLSRSMLLRDIWGPVAPTSPNIVDVHIGKLRRKIDVEGEPRMIFCVRGNGFRLGDTITARSPENDVVLREYVVARELQSILRV